jgi:hypothetical protein
MTRIMVEINPDGLLCGDCHGCCNLAGDRQWVEKCGGINEGHEDHRGIECFAAEELINNLRAYADHTYHCGVKSGGRCNCGYDEVLQPNITVERP